MKVTRYFQSCLLIEDGGIRILIDPSGQDKDRLKDIDKLDAVFYTHEHMDHFDPEMAQNFVEQGIAPVYANASTAKQVKASTTVVENGKEYDVKGMKIKALELPHCLMIDGSASVQNTGYLVNEKLFHPGDGKELAGLTVDTLAVPLNGPDISPKDAYDFVMQVGAKQAIPFHYDFLGGNPEFWGRVVEEKGVKAHSLKLGESIDL
ncbi:MAG TPA: MBL fold metallo-hydrolase [Candidatus Saccharimonadales bacterium]|nr:MBL fold metallo-hydrolase [Candidatus Saccharimonadales bacterium]